MARSPWAMARCVVLALGVKAVEARVFGPVLTVEGLIGRFVRARHDNQLDRIVQQIVRSARPPIPGTARARGTPNGWGTTPNHRDSVVLATLRNHIELNVLGVWSIDS
jgi:hypothetical protein